jgi:hypothetical protein
MKYISVLLIICIFNFALSAKFNELRNNHKVSNHYHSKNSTNSNSTAAPSVALNSIGRKVFTNNILLTKFPFTLTRCDQIVQFKAQFITDLAEFRNRQDGYFTITAHYANLFAGANANNLLKSILLSETKYVPRILPGSGGCIIISSKEGGNHDLTICTKDQREQENILEVFRLFFECNGGNSLGGKNSKPIDKLKVAEMIKSCGGKGKFVNPYKLVKKLKNKKDKSAQRKDKNWFHPGTDGMPGAPIVK